MRAYGTELEKKLHSSLYLLLRFRVGAKGNSGTGLT